MKLFPGKNEKLITSCLIAFVLGAIVSISANLGQKAAEVMLEASATLLAAFFGAKYAFSLQNNKQLEEKERENVEAGNKAIFTLINVYNMFCNYRDQFINEFRGKPIRHVAILPAVGLSECGEINFDSLAFLFRSKNPNILAEMSLVQSVIYSALTVIKERSELHMNIVQPKLEAAATGEDMEICIDDLRKILGGRTYVMLVRQTDQMIEFTDRVIVDTETLIESLKTLLKRQFPNHLIVGMEKLNNSSMRDTTSGVN